ncbi:MAG: GIN domain-containing protein [Sphingomicrobium sp.]
MRLHLPALLIAASLAAPAAGATRNFGVTSFERIRVDGPFKVSLATGVAPFARATGSQSALDGVDLTVEGKTLVVHVNRSSWGGYPGQNSGPVEISLGTHDLNAAWLNGSGSLQIDRVRGLSFDLSVQGSGSVAIAQADIDQLRVNLFGTAAASIAGRAGKMTAVIRGISSLDARGLATKDATIGAEGSATVNATVTNSAAVDGSGPATVNLSGAPACTVRVSGSATVSGCKSAQ